MGWSSLPEAKAVDEACVRRRMELGQDGAERGEIGAMQPEVVDLTNGDDPHADLRGGAHDCTEERLALFVRNLLRVVEARERSYARSVQELVVEEHPRDNERPRERAAARFVGPCDETHAKTPVERQQLLAGAARTHRELIIPSRGRWPTARSNDASGVGSRGPAREWSRRLRPRGSGEGSARIESRYRRATDDAPSVMSEAASRQGCSARWESSPTGRG
jgi:hypothetical protein